MTLGVGSAEYPAEAGMTDVNATSEIEIVLAAVRWTSKHCHSLIIVNFTYWQW
jgi:hypothetical protein